MSMHHQRMLQRYGLAHSTSLYSQVVFDPIFTPIFHCDLGALRGISDRRINDHLCLDRALR